MIYGLGTDIVECDRIAEMTVKFQDDFAHRILSEKEMELWIARKRSIEFLAGRWAVKEAFSKALGSGLTGKCISHEIEILPDENGAPHVTLYGITKKTAEKKNIKAIHASISHERHYAVATMLLISAAADGSQD